MCGNGRRRTCSPSNPCTPAPEAAADTRHLHGRGSRGGGRAEMRRPRQLAGRGTGRGHAAHGARRADRCSCGQQACTHDDRQLRDAHRCGFQARELRRRASERGVLTGRACMQRVGAAERRGRWARDRCVMGPPELILASQEWRQRATKRQGKRCAASGQPCSGEHQIRDKPARQETGGPGSEPKFKLNKGEEHSRSNMARRGAGRTSCRSARPGKRGARVTM